MELVACFACRRRIFFWCSHLLLNGTCMYLLYLDESGEPHGPSGKHFVLGGAAVFERQTFFLSERLDQIQAKHLPGVQGAIELHASSIRTGHNFWRKVPAPTRTALLQDIAATIGNFGSARFPGVTLFAAVVEKGGGIEGEKAVRRATEEVCGKFDTFLSRFYHESRGRRPERGLLVFDEGKFEQRSRVWVQEFRKSGTHWGALLRNLSDIPFFTPSDATRLIQVADFVCHAVFRAYEHQDDSLRKPILHRFDQTEGVLHGLAHMHAPGPVRACDCPACASRRTRDSWRVEGGQRRL